MSKFKVGDVIRVKDTDNVRFFRNNYKDNSPVGYVRKLTQDDLDCLHLDGNRFKVNFQEDDLELIEEVKQKFKVGDKVKVLNADIETHLIGKICEVIDVRDGKVYIEGAIYPWKYFGDYLELVEEECEPCVGNKEIIGVDDCVGVCGSTLINKKETFMSKATNYIKNLTLSADEKLLRKYGFKDGCGDYTGEAIDLVKMKLVKDNEAYLIEIAKGLEAEEEKNK